MSSEIPRAPEHAESTDERRTQRRVSVELPAIAMLRGVSTPYKGMTKNISWGGVLLMLEQPLPPGTGILRVILPWKNEERITALAQVLRVRELDKGRVLLATRFLSLSPRSHSRLERLLLSLIATAAPRAGAGLSGLVTELEVSANDREELREIMEEIATGRYTLRVFEAYALNQSLCFVLEGTDSWAGIRLRARVVEVKPAAASGFSEIPLFAVTLQFEHPKDSLANLVEHLIGLLPEPMDTSSTFGWSQMAGSPTARGQHPAPELQPQRMPKPRSAPYGRFARSTLRSTLEVDFPEALNYLMVGWGDAQTFESLFRDLMLGDRFSQGGWPPEAWEELTLLQDVHDRVYGLVGEREKFRRFGE